MPKTFSNSLIPSRFLPRIFFTSPSQTDEKEDFETSSHREKKWMEWGRDWNFLLGLGNGLEISLFFLLKGEEIWGKVALSFNTHNLSYLAVKLPKRAACWPRDWYSLRV